MREAQQYEVRFNDRYHGTFWSMADAMDEFKRTFEAVEAGGTVGHGRLDALFPTMAEAREFATQFAKSAKVCAMENRIHFEPVDSHAFTACVWADYDPQRDGLSNEAAHRRFKSILRTLG